VLGLSESTEHIIVCNGYKDHEFMRLALMGQKLGHNVFIVLEQVSELDVLLEVAEELGVQPTCGVRIKLASEGAGRWAQSGGEKSKFGLSSAELIKLIDKLETAGRLDILKLIHFHLGSQITDIRFIKSGLAEVARFYLELRALGVDITHVDVGGGLGIDYDGTNSTNNASVNYTLQEYANDVIYTIAEACREAELPMPHIISESGRALTAHHAWSRRPRSRCRRSTTTIIRCCTRCTRTGARSTNGSPSRARSSRCTTMHRSTRNARVSTSTRACSTSAASPRRRCCGWPR
jgi:arginine decarboxylase